jgi:hypothetical protein
LILFIQPVFAWAEPIKISEKSIVELAQVSSPAIRSLVAEASAVRLQAQSVKANYEARATWTRENRPDWQVYIAQALAPISDLRNLSNQLSCPLIVTLSPAPWQVSERAMPDPTARRHWGIAPGKVFDPSLATGPVIQFLDANSIPYCDATGPFREAERPEALFHETVPRLSRRGHALFARLVANYLKTSSLLPSSSPAFSPIPTASY